LMPKGRQWIGQTVFRRDTSWGKDWFPGKVTQWNEVTNKHHVLYEKTVDWEEFDEWMNLDKTAPTALRWEGEMVEEEPDEETSETEAELEAEPVPDQTARKLPSPKAKKPLRKKARGPGPARATGSPPALKLEDQLVYVSEKLCRLQGDVINPHVSMEEVEQFESANKIVLPSPYREFILQVGNGGFGPPKAGIPKLAEITEQQKYKLELPFPFVPDDLPPPQKMYLGHRRMFNHGTLPGDTKVPDAKEAEIVRRFNEQAWGGLMFMGADDDGDVHYLVVNGPGKGTMWLVADDCFGPQELDFLDWYLQWLDRQGSDKPARSGIHTTEVREGVGLYS